MKPYAKFGALVAIGMAGSLAGSPAQAENIKGLPGTVFNWTSVYVGVHGGYSSADLDWRSNYPYSISDRPTAFDNGDAIGGAQIGYMIQRGRWVFGGEISASGGFDTDTKTGVDLYNGNMVGTMSARLSTLFVSTTRVGYTFGNVLGYVKGGTALGLVTLTTDDNVPGDWLSRSHHWYSGWVLGAGVDYEIMPNLLLGNEYSYVTIDGKAATRIVTESGGFVDSYRSRVDLDMHSIVARLNYKFDAPVLATLLPF